MITAFMTNQYLTVHDRPIQVELTHNYTQHTVKVGFVLDTSEYYSREYQVSYGCFPFLSIDYNKQTVHICGLLNRLTFPLEDLFTGDNAVEVFQELKQKVEGL